MQRELAYRENDGVGIWLLWHSFTRRLTVSVFDRRNADGFDLDVEPANALDVFNHPFAYAAFRGVTVPQPREPVYA